MNFKKVVTKTSEQRKLEEQMLLELSKCPECEATGTKHHHLYGFTDSPTSYYYICECGCQWNVEGVSEHQ